MIHHMLRHDQPSLSLPFPGEQGFMVTKNRICTCQQVTSVQSTTSIQRIHTYTQEQIEEQRNFKNNFAKTACLFCVSMTFLSPRFQVIGSTRPKVSMTVGRRGSRCRERDTNRLGSVGDVHLLNNYYSMNKYTINKSK